MKHGVTPTAPAGDPLPPPRARAPLRLPAVLLAVALPLLAVTLIACELIAARVPQHRAALEQLIRRETGLELSFSELSVRFGWYGPEAVFHGVVLGEPAGRTLLRAARLSVSFDPWRTMRSGELEVGRITLENPDIDLAVATRAALAPGAAPGTDLHAQALQEGARILSRWRGGRIDVVGGTVRGLSSGTGPGVSLDIRHAQLRRLGAAWSAEAFVLLPERLGFSASLALEMNGDPAQPQATSGTLSVTGQRLDFAGWRALDSNSPVAQYLPQAGSGNLDFELTFAAGRVLSASGTLHAEALEWKPPSGASGPFALERLRGTWRLSQRGREWHLAVDRLEAGAPGVVAATLHVDASLDGLGARGRLQHVPLPALAAALRFLAPQLPLGALTFGGEARELTFDWSARRPSGAQLLTAADIDALAVAIPGREAVLEGLSGHVSGVDEHLVADLAAQDAQLTLAQEPLARLDGLEIAARLALDAEGNAWRLSTDDLELRRAGLSLAARGTLAAAAGGGPPGLDAHVALKDVDLALLARALGPDAVAALGAEAAHLTAGRIESADVSWRGPLGATAAWDGPGVLFTGALTVRDARLRGDELWPDADGVDARIDWSGPHLHAVIERARAGTFTLSSGNADWDSRSAQPLRFTARLAGSAEEALAWLRAHPQLAAWAPGAGDLDLRGDTLLDIALTSPPAAGRNAHPAPPRARVAALLDGVELHPLAGLPPIEALRGTVAFSGGHLERSTLTGQWLGGPVSLGVGEHREHGATALVISGRGVLDARRALQAAGGTADESQLSGNAEWSALLSLQPADDARGPRWQLHADSSLLGVTSRLPEPFAKAAAATLPLHVEVQGEDESGQLLFSVGERLRALAALRRSGDVWRIERGAVRLASTAPVLPSDPVVLLDGRLSELDLAAWLALWRAASADAALPELRARLAVGQLFAGTRAFAEASLAARVTRGGGALEVESAQITGLVRWPALIDAAHPAVVHLAGFDLTEPGDSALAAALATALAPVSELAVDDLKWQGHSLGRLSATLAARDDRLEIRGLRLSGGAGGKVSAGLECSSSACQARFTLDSEDAAVTLAAFGLRPDLSASRARLEGELQWTAQAPAPLATLDGHLHMQLEEGMTHPAGADGDAGADASAVPFALLSVPALLAGMSQPQLRFARLAADFELRDGEANTADLHFDGDAEILIRGRVGLAARNYDEQAWILRGEERLPAPVRRLGPTPRVAAAWLSLRELFAGAATDRTHAALRLRGSWNNPIVMPSE